MFFRKGNTATHFLKFLISNPLKITSAFKVLSSLRTKDSRNVINIISGIAAAGVAIGSLAMIVVLSAFNGLESLVSTLYTSVDPDVRISPIKGKVFGLDTFDYESVAQWEEIEAISPVLEETVFLQYEDQQNIVTLRGISEQYLPYLGIDSHIYEGQMSLSNQDMPAALLGWGIADNLNLYVDDGASSIKVFAAKRDGMKSLNPQNKFEMKRIIASGIIALNPEFDYSYFYTDFEFAEELLQYEGQATYLEVTLKDGVSVKDFKDKAQAHFGDNFEVKSRIELNDLIFKTNATEKWVTFFILCFILIVATFNLVGSITMLIIEKKKDISLLRSIGFSINDVRRVFLFEGLFITMLGMAIGLGVGVVIILLQQFVGFFPLQGGIVEFYPVELEWADLLAVIAVTTGIGFGASLLPVSVMLRSSKLQVVTAN
ncbi:ABC transporter permease [bacterium]|nr:ABC transporter permease [bacterium]